MLTTPRRDAPMTPLHRNALWVSLALLVTAAALFAADLPQIAGAALVIFFSLTAFGVRGHEKLRGISFGLLIFAAVTFAMCWPAPLVRWGEFELNTLIVPLLQIIMFGMGTAMSAKDFVGVVKSPKAVFVGLGCQFTIMPLVGAGLELV